MKRNLGIIITSCEKFNDLWQNLDVLYQEFWPNHPPILLVTDNETTKKYESFYISSFQSNYAFRLKQALESIDFEYVFLTLDDYLPTKAIDDTKIKDIVLFMDKNKYDYCRLFKNPRFGKTIDKNKKYKHLSLKKSCYEVNLYPGIWKRASLLKLIENDESPWQFEVMMTSRSSKNGFKCMSCRDMSIFPFQDTIRKGKYLRKAYRFLKNKKLFISNRQKRSIAETIGLNLKTFLGRLIPMFIVNRYRKSKMNKSYSSYAYRDKGEQL